MRLFNHISPLLAVFNLPIPALALWPVPQSVSTGSSALWVKSDIKVNYNGAVGGYANSTNTTFSSQTIVQGAISRTLDVVFHQSFVPWKLVARNELSKFEPVDSNNKKYITSLKITQTSLDNSTTFKPLAGQTDESYSLTIGTDGTASINATSSTGILHALETFTQLFYAHSSGCGIYTNLAPIAITDAPKFSHRGLNMDISRNWYPVNDILRTIDAISMNKFNRLHLHMTDAQSWPMQIPALPELAEKGAYQTGLSYSPSDIKNIQTYAIQRGVEVIIEFDMPGHTTAIGLAYPDLITGFDAQPWGTYCAEPPCGSLKLNSTAVDDFLEKLFSDVLPRVAPYSSYFHTGGDEVNQNVYLLDPTVNSSATEVLQPLIQKLVDRNHAQIRAAGLAPIVWEEMSNQWGLTLGDDVLVQSWISDEAVANLTSQGHKVIAGNYNYWYLDCGKGQWLDFTAESFQQYYPFADYCSPTKNWRLVYSYDPLGGVPEEEQHLVVGGEVHIWSEQTDPVNLDDMVWPRGSAAGEVLWAGRQDAAGINRTQIDASPRLAEMRERMVSRGIRAGPVQMVFCTQSNATECSL